MDRDVNIAQTSKFKRISHNNQANFDMNYKEKPLQHNRRKPLMIIRPLKKNFFVADRNIATLQAYLTKSLTIIRRQKQTLKVSESTIRISI